jgi:hypothetical protein
MLSSGPSPSQTSYGNPRQIVVIGSGSSTVMYTVPAGKKFQGTLSSNTTGYTVAITPTGGSMAMFQVPSVSIAPTTPALPITLVAGSIVTNIPSSNNSYLIGVETDA